jgi:hypothetical protein
MFTLRKGAIVSLGMFAGVGMNSAQACDNDRFPCPVVSETVTQETSAAPAEPVQVAQPPKKSQSARPATKPQPKAEQRMPRAKDREASLAARTTSKTAPQKQQAAPSPKKNDPASETAISTSTIIQPPASDQPPKEDNRNQAMVAAAGAVWPTPPAIDISESTATVVEATQPASEQTAQLSNGSDSSGKWSMFGYLLMIVSGILAVMSALWLLPRMRVRAKPEDADEEELAASPYPSN